MSLRRDLELMHRDVLSEASRLRATQDMLVAAGELGAPDPGKLAKAERFERIAGMLNDISLGNLVVQRVDGRTG